MGLHAVVIGAGMAGLLATRVLDGFFDRVTVLDRDVVPTSVGARKGGPQGRHNWRASRPTSRIKPPARTNSAPKPGKRASSVARPDPSRACGQGIGAPVKDEVRIDVGYATRVIQHPAADRRAYIIPPAAPDSRGGSLLPIEGERWLLTLGGVSEGTIRWCHVGAR